MFLEFFFSSMMSKGLDHVRLKSPFNLNAAKGNKQIYFLNILWSLSITRNAHSFSFPLKKKIKPQTVKCK